MPIIIIENLIKYLSINYIINRQMCIHPNCKVQPVYNMERETKALYCATHKLDRMDTKVKYIRISYKLLDKPRK